MEASPHATSQVHRLTGGCAGDPIVSVAGELLFEPSLAELERALARAAVVC